MRRAACSATCAEVVDCSGGDPEPGRRGHRCWRLLGVRGMRRVLTEGGPTLLGSFMQRDLLDELCLTIAPYIVGGLARRIATGPARCSPGCAVPTS